MFALYKLTEISDEQLDILPEGVFESKELILNFLHDEFYKVKMSQKYDNKTIIFDFERSFDKNKWDKYSIFEIPAYLVREYELNTSLMDIDYFSEIGQLDDF